MLKQNAAGKCNTEKHAHWTSIVHRCIHFSCSAEQHTFLQHSFNINHHINMFINFINRIYSCRSKMDKITYLRMNSIRNQLRRCNVPPNHRPACSSISQQRCHPRAGHYTPRNKGTSRLTHSQANQVGFIRPLRSWWRQFSKLVSS